jgi:hypothetical protein
MTEDFVQELEDGKHLLIDGCILLHAYIPENDAVKCHCCQTSAVYHEDFDSYICVYCNIWLEKKCGDPSCDYCPNRPDKPLPNENERRQLRNAKKQILFP